RGAMRLSHARCCCTSTAPPSRSPRYESSSSSTSRRLPYSRPRSGTWRFRMLVTRPSGPSLLKYRMPEIRDTQRDGDLLGAARDEQTASGAPLEAGVVGDSVGTLAQVAGAGGGQV